MRRWLPLMWALAGPLARLRVPPTAVTVVGVLVAADAVLLAAGHPWVALVLIVVAALCDGLDGAVAVIAGRATRSGAIADAVADRLADVLFAAVLWRCGAPWGVALACGAVALAVDGARRVRRVPDRVTVGERASWTVCSALACGSAAVTPAGWPVLVCAGVWLGLGAVALGQLARC